MVRVCTPNARGIGLIPGWGTKIMHIEQCSQKLRLKKKRHWERGSIVGVLPKLSDQQVVFLQLDLTKSP